MDDPEALTPIGPATKPGVAIALSGGGYRAMMFHVGALWRLNEVGLLGKLSRVSSVSGGSLTAGVLGLMWHQLAFAGGKTANFENFADEVRKMAGTTVDVGAVIGGILLPGDISARVAKAYDNVLFKGATLQDLPDDSAGTAPRFVINATNIQTAALWRFSRPYMGDRHVGLIKNPTLSLADAVAASSAFPPILSPATIPITQPVDAVDGADLSKPLYTKEAILSDGGVYDNLGLETTKQFRTLLVSDAGQKIAPEGSPHRDWARHAIRVLDVIDNQVRSLRARDLISSYKRGDHDGCYWGIRGLTKLKPGLDDTLATRGRDPTRWASVPTRLEKMPEDIQNGLINWGYASADIGLRGYFADGALALGADLTAPTKFPVGGEY